MKSTKRILSAILALCMVFGCFAVGFTAQASSADLQKAIDDAIAAGIDVEWKGGNITVDKTIVIDGDVTVDFNNATLTGAAGISVVNVKGGNVTLYNGTFIATQKEYSGETGFIKSLLNYRPAVSINGGNVVLDCVTAVGSLIRIPNSGTVEVTAGNGINANAGNVTVKDTIAVGMKALDNTKATVVIEDALFVGIYKAINDVKKVTYADGYKQYKTIDFLKDLLADGVTLTDGEEDYIDALTNSQGNLSAASVIASVKAPEFADLVSDYEDETLTITAAADAENEKSGVPNRYSYKYTPVSASIDSVEVPFVEKNGAYTAQFSAEAESEYEVTVDYKLSVKLGKQQKEILEGALDTVAKYADKAPELLYRFVKDFEALWVKAEEYVSLVYGVLTDELTADMFNSADMKELKAVIYSVIGQNKVWNGNDKCFERDEVVGSRYNKALSRLNGATTDEAFASAVAFADSSAAAIQADEIKFGIYEGFEGFFDGKIYAYKNDLVATGADGKYTFDDVVKYMSGKGLLEEFEEHYDIIKGMLYGESTTEFADPAAAAEYVGDNWEDLLALVENAVVIFNKVDEIVNAEDSQISQLLEEANIGSVDALLDAFNKGAKYVDKIVARLDDAKNSSFAAKYGDKAGYFCKLYTKKVLNIANNPSKYFDIEVEGNYVNLFEFEQVQTVVTGSDKPITVYVNVHGSGSANLNGKTGSAYVEKTYNLGEEISLLPVEGMGDYQFMIIKSNGIKSVVNAESYVSKAATNLYVDIMFTEETAVDTTEVTFLTDKALGYKYLDKVEVTADSVDEDIYDFVTPPVFKDMTFVKWSKTPAEIVAEIESGVSVVLVYAEYEYEETVKVPVQSEFAKMTDKEVLNGKAYFEVTFQVPAEYTVIESGVIVTKTAAYATEDAMTTELSGEPGVSFARATLKDPDGSIMRNLVYTAGVKTTGVVYARGYVVYEDAAGNVGIAYTAIADLTV